MPQIISWHHSLSRINNQEVAIHINLIIGLLIKQYQTFSLPQYPTSMQENLNRKKYETQFFYKAFLRPMEVCLRTAANEPNRAVRHAHQKKVLPSGLLEVRKANISQNKYKLQEFFTIPLLNEVKKKGWNNLISLIKGVNGDETSIKVAICVCMYNQSKLDLYRTISGISNNIREFVENGIPAHQIVVCIIIDGIQTVDPSIQEIIEEFQKENGMYFSESSDFTDAEDVLEIEKEHGESMINVGNKALGMDFEDYKMGRFAARREEYKRAKKFIIEIQQLEKQKNLTFDSLNSTFESFFVQIAKKRHKQLYGWDDDEINKKPSDFFIQKYGYDQLLCRSIIREALGRAKRYFQEYISSRQKLAIVNPFRVDVNQITSPQRNQEEGTQQLLNIDGEQFRLIPKMNLFFVTKYKNCGKLDSHNWFINGFCNQFNPEYSILLDVGLIPNKQALLKMVQQMEADPKIGGNCGFMGVKTEKISSREQVDKQNLDWLTNFCLSWVNIQRAQQFQYHFAHLVDKPFESLFNFIHVLPGAFSAYRMKALRNQDEEPDEESKLLKEYFHSMNNDKQSASLLQFSVCQTIMMVILPELIYNCIYKTSSQGDEQNLYNSNVYLAEDRIMCLGIHTNGYNLAYLPDAFASVDSMKTLHGLMGQRRRWINGSYFAFSKTKQELGQSNKCSFISIQNFYLQIVNWLVFVSPALFLFTVYNSMCIFNSAFFIPLVLKEAKEPFDLILPNIVNYIYVVLFLGLIFFSMHLNHNDKYYQKLVYAASTAYGIISLISFGFLIYGLAQDQSITFIPDIDKQNYLFVSRLIKFIVIGTVGLYMFTLVVYELLYRRWNILIDILLSLFSLLFYLPTYLNIFNIYAICRIDDISWGTKGKESQDRGGQNIQKINWKKIKLIHVSKYVVYNCVFGLILLKLGSTKILYQMYTTLAIMAVLSLVVFFKVILGILYLLKYKFCSKKCESRSIDFENKLNDIFEQLYESLHRQLRVEKQNKKKKFQNQDEKLQKVIPPAILQSIIMKIPLNASFKVKKNQTSTQKSSNQFS